MRKKTECTLCGLPNPIPAIQEDGHPFCCHGCKEVYRVFGAQILDQERDRAPVNNEIELGGREAFLRIDGMHCSSCEILIEQLALKLDGVLSVSSSYATSAAKIRYDPDRVKEDELPKILTISGYKARLSNSQKISYDYRQDLLRLLTGITLGGLVMMLYVAFFYPTHLGLVDAADLKPINWLAFKVAPWTMFFVTTILIFYVGFPILRGALIGFKVRMLNMDNLLTIAIFSAYTYSLTQLLLGSLDLYFDVASTIVVVVTIGRYIERTEKNNATKELSKLIDAWAPKARTRWGGGYQFQNIEDLEPGDHVIILEGESIPIDGKIIYGRGAIDEALMTGEPFPIAKVPGEKVIGGSILVDGEIEIQVSSTVESQIQNLARILWDVQSSNAGAQGFADRVARIFVPVVLFLSVTVFAVSMSYGSSLNNAFLLSLATLIVSCPCTFGLAIPLTTAIGVSRALQNGIIVTSADTFEKVHSIDTVAIDKTGTLSTGKVEVVTIIGATEIGPLASAVERLSPHPIARAIAKLETSNSATNLEIHPGKGAIAEVDGRQVGVGSKSLFKVLGWAIPKNISEEVENFANGRNVISYVGWNKKIYGAIITSDHQRPKWKEMVKKLKQNSRVILLTGAEDTSGYKEHVDGVFSGIPPEGKAAVIRQLKTEGTVVMIGDGSNDAPALAEANLGIAFGSPTSLAADAADIVIPGEDLHRVFGALKMIRTIKKRSRQNLGWALLYNLVAIPLATIGLLNPLFAAIAMSSSSLLVVWNSSREYK